MSHISAISPYHPVGLPFNLDLALRGAPLITACGLAARIVAVNDAAPESFRLKVQLEGQSHPRSFCLNGKFYSDGRPTDWDLFLAPAAANGESGLAHQLQCEAIAA